MRIDEGLLEFATDVQAEYVKALNKTGSVNNAAELLGKNPRSITRSIARLKKAAARQNYSSEHGNQNIVAPGYVVKGTSTFYDGDGIATRQWVKTEQDKEDRYKYLFEAIEDACTGLKPLPVIKTPKQNNGDLCSLYTLTDFHLGMLAWSDETGADWDTDIAQKVLLNAFNDLVETTPDSEIAILNVMGDFLHFDNLNAITPASGHLLDSDTRFAKLVDLTIEILPFLVQFLLEKHKKVYVKVLEGNHDPASTIWMRTFVNALFKKNKRVEVDVSPFPFCAHQHGKVMIGLHHGHKVKNKSLPALFSSEPRFRKMWGDCEYTYIHSGHYHQTEQEMSEHGGAIVERHPTLAARDAYAARGGYVSIRAARSITYHKERGEMYRSTVVPRLD